MSATARGPAAVGRPPAGFDRRLLAPMVLGAILNPVNSSIIAVSLVPIGRAFGAPPSATAWLVSGLYLATAIGQPVVGRLVDVAGPRRLFLAGSALVGLGGLAGALAPSLGVLVASRVVLGLGTCAGYPAAMHLVRSEARRTGRDSPQGVLTVLAVSTQTIAVIGPTLGGLLIGLGGWRATFAVNVPLAAASLVMGALRLPRADALADDASNGRPGARLRLDVAGMTLFAAALVALLVFLLHPATGRTWLLGLSAVVAGAFAVRELRTATPFLDLRVLGGNTPLLLTYVRALLAYCVSYAVLYGYTQWLEDGRGLSASGAGLALVPLFAVGIAVSALTGRHPQVRAKLVVGSLGQLAASVLLLTVDPSSGLELLVVIAAVLGLPQGLNGLAIQNAVYRQADAERTASSAGLLRTFGYLGAIVASAVSALAFGPRATTPGLHHLALFMVVLAAALLVTTVADRSLGSGRTPRSERTPA